MKDSKIEWCDHTFNPWMGCTKVSPACDHCYAEVSGPARVHRARGVEMWGPQGQRVRTSAANWRQHFSLDGPVDVPHGAKSPIDWVIVGGESGPHARPMHPAWVRDMADQCAEAGVAFFFKQWGEFMPPESASTRYPANDWRDVVDSTGATRPVRFVGDAVLESSRQVVRVGKKAAGRLLDGREWNEVPA